MKFTRATHLGQSHLDEFRRGFTLIELLVVIGVIALLMSFLIPALAGSRGTARVTVETAAGRSAMEAVTLYGNDFKSAIMPGYPPVKWITGGQVRDQANAKITGPSAQRYPWRLLPYLDYNFGALYKDKRVISRILEQTADAEYLVSLYPSLGMNVAFVGGSANHFGFDATMGKLFGSFYVTHLESVQAPSKLIAFASARAKEPSQVNIGNPEGYFLVEAPTWGAGWQATYEPDAIEPGVNSGHVGLRYGNKAIVSMLDGHADTLKWDDLRDMRRWVDRATTPTWKLEPKK